MQSTEAISHDRPTAPEPVGTVLVPRWQQPLAIFRLLLGVFCSVLAFAASGPLAQKSLGLWIFYTIYSLSAVFGFSLERRGYMLLSLPPLRPRHVPVRQRQFDILIHRQIANQIECLKNKPDLPVPNPRSLGRLQRSHRLPPQRILPSRRRIQQAQTESWIARWEHPLRAWLQPQWLRRLGTSALIGGQAVAAIARGRIGFNDLMAELMEAGPGSFLIVLITGIAAGTVFNIQVAAELTKQGAGATVGGILAVGLAREIAPILTATLVTGKVATAYAAQLGTMKVTEQIDAITMLRTDPVEYLVVPRLLAMLIMTPVQCLLFFSVAVWSGQLSSTALYNIPPQVFWNSVRTWLDPSDLPSMLTKAVVFGLQIAVIACGWGLTTRGGPKEVGTSTTGAVVMILVTVSLVDVVLTQILFGD